VAWSKAPRRGQTPVGGSTAVLAVSHTPSFWLPSPPGVEVLTSKFAANPSWGFRKITVKKILKTASNTKCNLMTQCLRLTSTNK